MVGNGACANLRSFACRWAVAANACVSFWLARCARGGCEWSEMELALIYVRSLCRWAVAANAYGLAALGPVANGRKRRLRK